MGKNIDKRLWGVLGKQQTYFSPQKQVEGKTKTPLNSNAFDSWDAKRSRFKRVDGYENAVQQGGVPEPVPTTPTPTPSFTPTQTQTNTPTNSSTPTNTASVTPTNTNTPTQTNTPSSPASGTTEANTYLSAVVNAGGTGITSTVSAATRTLFTSLVFNGLYDKMLAFYPMLGGNSLGCKFNGKNPIDTNLGFRLVFNGGWTFNSSGATSNGTNAYADTFLSGGSITVRDNHLSVYMLNENVYTGVGKNYIGVYGTGGSGAYFSIGQEGTPKYFYGPKINGGVSSSGAPLSSGFNIITTTGLTFQNLYRNGVVQQTNINAGNGDSVVASVIIGAANNNGIIQQYYDNTYAFATIGLGLGETQQSTLSTIINTFQTTLSRNTF